MNIHTQYYFFYLLVYSEQQQSKGSILIGGVVLSVLGLFSDPGELHCSLLSTSQCSHDKMYSRLWHLFQQDFSCPFTQFVHFISPFSFGVTTSFKNAFNEKGPNWRPKDFTNKLCGSQSYQYSSERTLHRGMSFFIRQGFKTEGSVTFTYSSLQEKSSVIRLDIRPSKLEFFPITLLSIFSCRNPLSVSEAD